MKSYKQRVLILTLLGFLFVLSGCASFTAGGPPPWLDSLYDKQYNEEEYLCAIGSGSSREKASDAALASLSQVFNSQVRSVTTVLSLSTADKNVMGEVTFTEQSEMLDQGTVSSSTDRIVGAEVVNTYIDDNARVYVRVALNRKRTAEIYKKEIALLDNSIMEVKRSLIPVTEPLKRYFTLKKAVAFALKQQNLYDQIEVLLKKSQSSTLLLLEQELAQIASSVKIAVAVDSPSNQQVLFSAFSQKLVELGFSVVSIDDNPTAFLSLYYNSTPLEMAQSPYKYVRYTLSGELTSGSTTLFSFQKSEREAAMSAIDAEKKALLQATTSGVSQFFTLLQEMLGDSK